MEIQLVKILLYVFVSAIFVLLGCNGSNATTNQTAVENELVRDIFEQANNLSNFVFNELMPEQSEDTVFIDYSYHGRASQHHLSPVAPTPYLRIKIYGNSTCQFTALIFPTSTAPDEFDYYPEFTVISQDGFSFVINTTDTFVGKQQCEYNGYSSIPDTPHFADTKLHQAISALFVPMIATLVQDGYKVQTISQSSPSVHEGEWVLGDKFRTSFTTLKLVPYADIKATREFRVSGQIDYLWFHYDGSVRSRGESRCAHPAAKHVDFADWNREFDRAIAAKGESPINQEFEQIIVEGRGTTFDVGTRGSGFGLCDLEKNEIFPFILQLGVKSSQFS